MKIVIWILIVVVSLFLASEPSVSFKPFSINFNKPFLPFAIGFLALGIVFFSHQYENIGYEKGIRDTLDYLIKKSASK